MIEILPELERDALLPRCKALGRGYSTGLYAYTARERGEELAAGVFEVQADFVALVSYTAQEQDAFLLDGILRAGLNYADAHGITTGVIPEPVRQAHAALFAKLNCPNAERFDITNFFLKYKNCGGMRG